MAETNGAPTQPDVDVVVVGAGFAGLYMLHKLRGLGFTATVLEAADDVGGTWYWNRYPGARCDIPTTDYTFGFDPELEAEWTWSEKYATQPEILRYLQFVAERYDLRRDIRFRTRATEATWDESSKLWRIGTDPGPGVTARYYVMATGCLSVPKEVDIAGADRFRGEVYFTSRWPHEGVDFTGKRVGVIGTGSSGIQSIPLIAAQASELTVFQRTPNFSIPAHNGPAPQSSLAELAADRAGYRDRAKWSRIGVPREPAVETAAQLTPEERKARFDAAVAEGTLGGILASLWADLGTNPEANNLLRDLLHDRIRSIVRDPETAEALCPTDHYFGTKRPCLDTGYYETFNEPHVKLVNLRKEPITTVTETGIETAERSFEFDAIVYATGFDAMTGAIVGVDITGKGGRTLKEKWDDGPHTYLGLLSVGFPNLFMVTGPQSPSVLSNMAVSIEQHVEWIAGCLTDMREGGYTTIEPTQTAEEGWERHNGDCAAITLHPTANSWYMGANVPDKPRVFLAYIGGVDAYRAVSDEVREKRYLGFRLEGPGGVQENDGVVRRVQPDVAMVLDMMASLDLPPLESMSPAEARAFMDATNADRPTGPEVGEIVDGVLPGPAGDLAYRLYRPDTPGPHPLVVYYHGGGWVLGSADSDDPLCRDLCARSGAAIISVDYRHGPEARFPASHDDAWAALRWVGDHVTELGGIPGQLAVAGWSAGGNLAAVVAQQARDAGGPELVGQLLLTPVTDSDMSRPSYTENGEGYVLTKPLMEWFFDHYVDPADRKDPRMAPLHADLANLPPAVIITGEFDPLRDEGNAYAEALERAGNQVRLIPARGHTHTSMTMVDVVLSGAPYREQMAEAIAGFFARVPA
ncbi:flavin-containing monooxygenase [Pseudonocardia lacus]|uniref:flavin-containing monooxygenase n=1 Tax=Pseudonocardia lacus TaxID=2835865 RepID=UPI001BDD358E|nr:alpha/beta fold hydrolase [Pseudonocardia lacus]